MADLAYDTEYDLPEEAATWRAKAAAFAHDVLAPIARDAFVTKVGFEASLSDTITLGAAYTGQYGTGTTAHGANGNLRVVF